MKKILSISTFLIFIYAFPQKKSSINRKDSTIVDSIKNANVITNAGILGKHEILKTDLEIASKILKSKGSIFTRNFDFKGNFGVYFKGIYVYTKNNKIYFLLEMINKSYIDYNVDMISFSTKNDNSENIENLDNENSNLHPINAFPNQSIFKGKTKTKVVLVFNKFSISEKSNLVLNISEKNGNRDIEIEVKGKWFVGAKSIY